MICVKKIWDFHEKVEEVKKKSRRFFYGYWTLSTSTLMYIYTGKETIKKIPAC